MGHIRQGERDRSRGIELHDDVMLMGKHRLGDASDDDYVEDTSNDLDDPDFLEDFAHATLQLWPR